MEINRRQFFKITGTMAAASLLAEKNPVQAARPQSLWTDTYGCLVDTTLCIGCRLCEQACNERHQLSKPRESFEELAVLERMRRMDETSYTVINRYGRKETGPPDLKNPPTFVKFQCMHCQDPACVSACIVGALTKHPSGPVTYDVKKCIGCRYCMIACPFQVPAYEYHDPLTPEVRKCTFCFHDIQEGKLPACVQFCPREVITFGKRSELLHLANWKIRTHPGRYQKRIYGEKEVGGTSWLYLSSGPFESIGLPSLGTEAPPRLTEAIQHGLFQYFATPLILFAALGGVRGLTGYLNKRKEKSKTKSPEKGARP
ncbi:MAG: 4Fe-4S dicluster domain-containing protein [Deltaproteobacteria bacterium]|nr:4Fe-4S dicluster domain-containing protein [Deltaproteobacteria bacterium]